MSYDCSMFSEKEKGKKSSFWQNKTSSFLPGADSVRPLLPLPNSGISVVSSSKHSTGFGGRYAAEQEV